MNDENGRENLLGRIRELSFAMDEVILYLDGHPNNRAALSYLYETRDRCNRLRDEYEGKYGPLTVNGVHGERWTWTEGPWPWQRESDMKDFEGK